MIKKTATKIFDFFMIIILFCLVCLGFFKDVVYSSQKYDRSKFGSYKDYDRDGLNTREEVLLKSHPTMIKYSQDGRTIYDFESYCFYTGKLLKGWESAHIDHAIPLYVVWQRGGHSWSEDKLNRFNNDLRNLYLIDKYENLKKSAKFITRYLPPEKEFRYFYLTRVYIVAMDYEIPLYPDELNLIKKYVNVDDIDAELFD